MRITIEKTESGYSVTSDTQSVEMQAVIKALQTLAQFVATPLQPKEPEIPACLHCGSKFAPRFSIATKPYWIICDAHNGGCGTETGHQFTKEKAIALWAGVKNA